MDDLSSGLVNLGSKWGCRPPKFQFNLVDVLPGKILSNFYHKMLKCA